jgi:putative FmdB family regulatory protein
MPLFTFECEACGVRSELLVAADAKPECPACGSKRMVKQAGRFAAQVAASSSAPPAPCGQGGPCGSGSCPFN